MRKRKEIAVERANTASDGKEYRITLEYSGMYENLRSPKLVATLREEHAEQLIGELQEVVGDGR